VSDLECRWLSIDTGVELWHALHPRGLLGAMLQTARVRPRWLPKGCSPNTGCKSCPWTELRQPGGRSPYHPEAAGDIIAKFFEAASEVSMWDKLSRAGLERIKSRCAPEHPLLSRVADGPC